MFKDFLTDKNRNRQFLELSISIEYIFLKRGIIYKNGKNHSF